jgi:hypothetical protein
VVLKGWVEKRCNGSGIYVYTACSWLSVQKIMFWNFASSAKKEAQTIYFEFSDKGIESLPHKKNLKTRKKKFHKNGMTKPHKFVVNST